MNIQLYILPKKIGLKFTQSADRDAFWTAMPALARACADRIGNRSIRFYPDRFQDKNGLIIPLSSNGASPVPVSVAPPKSEPQVAKPPPSNIVNVSSVADPFALTGNAVKALPGMVAVASNIPSGSPQERSGGITTPPTPENASQGQPNAVAVASGVSETLPEPAQTETEPPDKRTKAWRNWKLRQIEREKTV